MNETLFSIEEDVHISDCKRGSEYWQISDPTIHFKSKAGQDNASQH